MEHLVAYVPEIRQMKMGTINLALENPVHFSSWDVETDRIHWNPQWPDFSEWFRIVRGFIRLQQAASAERVPCLLYFAETSPVPEQPVCNRGDFSQFRAAQSGRTTLNQHL
jgi:hypothetical protein